MLLRYRGQLLNQPKATCTHRETRHHNPHCKMLSMRDFINVSHR